MRFDYRADATVNENTVSPFSYDKLIVHRDRHMGREVAELNTLLDGIKWEKDARELYYTPNHLFPRYMRGYLPNLRVNAAGYYSHSIYFSLFASCRGCPEGLLRELICSSFNSLEYFYYLFRHTAEISLGSGFLWLLRSKKTGKLSLKFLNQGYLPPSEYSLILALDLWEHAWEASFKSKNDYALAYLSALDYDRINDLLSREKR